MGRSEHAIGGFETPTVTSSGDEDWPALAAEGRGAIGEEARAGSHQLLAIGEHLTAILRKHLHLPVHAFLAGGRSVGHRSSRRQLADELGRKCHS